MTAGRARLGATIGVLVMTLALGASVGRAQTPMPTASPRVRYRVPGAERRDLARHEQTIRRGRNKIRQILRDPQASPEVKKTATELDGLLDRRHALIVQLKTRHKEFIAQHEADITELRELSRRAHEVNLKLDAARDETISASNAQLAELKEISTRAAQLAETLRTSYDQEQRARRDAR